MKLITKLVIIVVVALIIGVEGSTYSVFFVAKELVEGMGVPEYVAVDIAAESVARSFLRSFLLVIIAPLVVFWGVFRLMIVPIKKLQDDVERIAGGDIKHRVLVERKDEIGELAQSFNQMVDTVAGEEWFRKDIIKALPGALFLTDTAGNIVQTNPKVMELFGYDKKELDGKSITMLFPTKTGSAQSLSELDELAEKGKIRDRFVTMLTKNGTKIPVVLHGRLIKQKEHGDPIALLVALDRRSSQEYASKRLQPLISVLEAVASGDFSQSLDVPVRGDEFVEITTALNLMIDDLRKTVGRNTELVEALEKEKMSLEGRVKERTANVDAANQQLQRSNQRLEAANQQLAATQEELQEKIGELERFNRVTMGRELRVLELKEEVAVLKEKIKKKS